MKSEPDNSIHIKPHAITTLQIYSLTLFVVILSQLTNLLRSNKIIYALKPYIPIILLTLPFILNTVAIPKSLIFILSCSSNKRFSGFRSRCATPQQCRYSWLATYDKQGLHHSIHNLFHTNNIIRYVTWHNLVNTVNLKYWKALS